MAQVYKQNTLFIIVFIHVETPEMHQKQSFFEFFFLCNVVSDHHRGNK